MTSYKNSGYVDNWQVGKTVTECNLHMLTTEDCSDVIFRVGSEKHVVRAHRYVLVSRSCVFHAMFCGPLAEKGEVTIPDIDSCVFKEFLRYIYTDTIEITVENVTGLLYTSRKYAVDGLLNQCSAFIESSLTEENVCQILEQCHGYGEVDLEQKALKILNEGGEKVTKSPGFMELCSDCLGLFLKSDQLRMKEEHIFEATLSWTKRQCQKENRPVTNKTIWECLGDMRFEIRFGTMSLEYLANVVGPSEFLTGEERLRIMDKILLPDVDISPFKSKERQSHERPCSIYHYLPWKYVHRFQGDAYLFRFPNAKHAISFSVSRNIHLLGCQVYGADHLNFQCTISVKLLDSGANVLCKPFSDSFTYLRGRGQLNNILFPDAVHLMASHTYTLCVTLPMMQTWYGEGGRESVCVDGVTFTFTDSPKSTSGTTVLKGQIPGLVFHV